MKKIVLLCNMGLSTSALVTKIRSEAENEGFECTVDAYPASEASNEAADADVILIGPQVSYLVEEIKDKCPGIPCEAISMQDYGMMNGKAVLTQAKKMMGE